MANFFTFACQILPEKVLHDPWHAINQKHLVGNKTMNNFFPPLGLKNMYNIQYRISIIVSSRYTYTEIITVVIIF